MAAVPHAILATLCYLVSDVNGAPSTLMHERKAGEFQQGFWIAFGGKNEIGESPEVCIAREYKEETGLVLVDPILRGKVYFDNRKRVFNEGGGVKPDNLVDIFECSKFTGTLTNPRAVWVPNRNLRNLNMPPGDLLILDWMEKREARFFSGVLRYEIKDLLQSEVTFYYPDGKVERIVRDYRRP